MREPELRLKASSGQDRGVNQRYARETDKGNRKRFEIQSALPITRRKRQLTNGFNWKQHNVAITISELDRLKNAGSSKVVDVVKAKMENAKKTCAYKFGTGLYSAGTDPKSISGARTFLSTSATYGGVSQSTESWLN